MLAIPWGEFGHFASRFPFSKTACKLTIFFPTDKQDQYRLTGDYFIQNATTTKYFRYGAAYVWQPYKFSILVWI